METIVIYHNDCPDGAAAAWIASQESKKYKMSFHATNFRDWTKDRRFPNINNKTVFILDFCYPRETLLALATLATHVYVLDHHETAEHDLQNIHHKNLTCIFDLNRCGAEITWDFFHPQTDRPWWLLHIRDRDLWEWKHPMSHAFSSAFFHRGISMITIQEINDLDEEGKAKWFETGQLLYELQKKTIDTICKSAQLVLFQQWPIYIVESLIYRSEIGALLAAKPECAWAAVYHTSISCRTQRITYHFSLRGSKGHNLGEIARSRGGGGNKNTASFSFFGNLFDLFSSVPPVLIQ